MTGIRFNTTITREHEFGDFSSSIPLVVEALVQLRDHGENVHVEQYHVENSDDGSPVQLLPDEVRDILTLAQDKALIALPWKPR